MRRQGQYGDSGVNAYVAQMQHMTNQRMQNGPGLNHFSGREDSLPSDDESPYISSKVESQWQWDRERDRDGEKGPNPMASQHYSKSEGGDAARSFYSGQRTDSKMGFDKQASIDTRSQPHEQDMEIGYEDNPLQPTFEGLMQKFHEEVMKLTKDQHEAEDTENARHREKLGEINVQYQEKLIALRVQHASRREDFLQRESKTRQNQYQQAGMKEYQNPTVQNESRGYGGAATTAAVAAAEPADTRRNFTAEAVDARRTLGAGQYDSYRERAQYLEGSRNQGFESRGPYPGGRAYNNTRYY